MTRAPYVLGGLLVASGAIFVAQGLGILRGSSFMVDDLRWSWIGGGLVVGGIALAALAWRRTQDRRG